MDSAAFRQARYGVGFSTLRWLWAVLERFGLGPSRRCQLYRYYDITTLFRFGKRENHQAVYLEHILCCCEGIACI